MMITNCAKMRSFNCFTLIIATVPPRAPSKRLRSQPNYQFLRGAQRAVNHARRLPPPGVKDGCASGQSRHNSVCGPMARELLQTPVSLDEAVSSARLACISSVARIERAILVSVEDAARRWSPFENPTFATSNGQACAFDALWKAS